MKKSILMLIIGLVVGLILALCIYCFFFKNTTKADECPECEKCTETKCEDHNIEEYCNNSSLVYFKKVNSLTYLHSFFEEPVTIGDKIVLNYDKLVSINDTKFSNVELSHELCNADNCSLEAYDFGDFYGIMTHRTMCEKGFAFYDKNGKILEIVYDQAYDNKVGINDFYVKNNSIYATVLKGCATGMANYEIMRLVYENNKVYFVK